MEAHITALAKAAASLHIHCQHLDDAGNLVRLSHQGRNCIFQSNRTPFNTEVMAGICLDKGHTYQLLKDAVPMPRTLAILDFAVAPRYRQYLALRSLDQALARIEDEFDYPVVVKRNRGALASNVFLCHDPGAVADALGRIFDRQRHSYDFIALAQEFLPTAREYRVVCHEGEVVFAYERVLEQSDFKAAYWTLPGGAARYIGDRARWRTFEDFAAPIFQVLPLGFVGLDVLETRDGRLVLLELNSGPRFDHISENEGDDAVVAMYRRVLGRYFGIPL